MCAVIGAIFNSPSDVDFDILHKIFIQSSVRGLHATGLSYVRSDKIFTIKSSINANKFQFDFSRYLNEDGNLYLIGHCRYSTSDIEYNQPISDENVSIAHNGVISQESPEIWQKLYNYKCQTKNDTELLLHTINDNKSPLKEWSSASLAVCELYKNKKLRVYRNGKRPLYYTSVRNGYIIASTKDILRRSGINSKIEEMPMNVYMKFCDSENIECEEECIDDISVDLQKCK